MAGTWTDTWEPGVSALADTWEPAAGQRQSRDELTGEEAEVMAGSWKAWAGCRLERTVSAGSMLWSVCTVVVSAEWTQTQDTEAQQVQSNDLLSKQVTYWQVDTGKSQELRNTGDYRAISCCYTWLIIVNT